MHTFGVWISIIGIVLSGLGVIGDERVKRWEKSFRNLLNIDSWNHSIFSLFESKLASLILVILLISSFAWLIFINISTEIPTIILYISGIAFLVLLIWLFVIPTLFAFLYLVLLPYKILDLFIQRQNMQSTLILVGIICAIVRLIFLEVL